MVLVIFLAYIGNYYLYSISISVENDMGEGEKTLIQLRTEESGKTSNRNTI